MKNIAIWFLWFALAETAVYLVSLLFGKKQIKKGAVKAALIILELVLGSALALLVIAGPVSLRKLQFFMTAMYVALFGEAAKNIVCLLPGLNRCGKGARRVISLVFGLAFFVFGTLNMQNVTANRCSYSSGKLDRSYRAVFVSDVHVGGSQPFAVDRKMVEEIKALDPDFVILGGDITDDYTTREEAEEFYALFKDFPSDVYFIYGNHDRQHDAAFADGPQYTENELKDMITRNGIAILQDEFVQIGDDLTLLGREDVSESSRKDPAELENPYPGTFLLTADHSPYEKDDIRATGSDLQLSGHSHAGQFFPLEYVYELTGCDAFGDYVYGSTVSHVSPGASGWRIPFRSSRHSSYEVVSLIPA